MAILSKDQIKSNIQSELSDNNAGLISAYDVRHNMEDIVDSINQIVASGNFDSATPFTGSNVRAKIVNGQYGSFVVESGIIFPNGGNTVQYQAYPGPSGIQHNSLDGLSNGDPHTQYININGVRTMDNNFGLKNHWLNSSGNSTVVSSTGRGISFEHVSGIAENVKIGSQTKLVFTTDNSSMESAKGIAKAWINFNASGNIEVRDSYNIKQIERVSGSPGKFKITFTSGTLENNNYVALGHSNARNDFDEGEDFDRNTVGLVRRIGDDAVSLRSITFYVLNPEGNYVDAAVNDLVVFGRSKGATSGTPPTIVN
jgi:hypothetical protein